ncbi:hypothetical protein HDU98_009516 [Podochytrium sp. JEL0797]|nr:hypothetical protein HDU98_009516 [Podochytrium sp. JEL0797]
MAAFLRIEHLNRHQKCTHQGIKEFLCIVCPSQFGRNDELLRHLRMHVRKGELDASAVPTMRSRRVVAAYPAPRSRTGKKQQNGNTILSLESMGVSGDACGGAFGSGDFNFSALRGNAPSPLHFPVILPSRYPVQSNYSYQQAQYTSAAGAGPLSPPFSPFRDDVHFFSRPGPGPNFAACGQKQPPAMNSQPDKMSLRFLLE